jgi:hypothetical protein
MEYFPWANWVPQQKRTQFSQNFSVYIYCHLFTFCLKLPTSLNKKQKEWSTVIKRDKVKTMGGDVPGGEPKCVTRKRTGVGG